MPVLPAVPSTISPPRSITPRRSASSTMYFAARSLTEPPGFRNSALPRIVQPVISEALRSLMSGVLPTASTKSERISIVKSLRAFSYGSARLLHGDRDLFGTNRRLMGDMVRIAEHELQRVLPRRQRELDLGLPGAEVTMLVVVRDRQVVRRQIGVDQQV